MRRLKRFLELCPRDRRLLLRALLLVCAIRLGLCLLPFRFLLRVTRQTTRGAELSQSAARCAWAVQAVSRYVPGATCLTRALAAQFLLARAGCDSRIEIGVTKDQQGCFRAHAWVVCHDRIVIGGAEAEKYVPLAAWKAAPERTNSA